MLETEEDVLIFSSSLPSSPLPSSPLPSLPGVLLSPTPSPLGGRFNRLRSSSLHSTAAQILPANRLEEDVPPLPPLPSGSLDSGVASIPTSPISDDLSLSSPTLVIPQPPQPYIKSCSVPHHTKLDGKWVYACRVVPSNASVGDGGVKSPPGETQTMTTSMSRSSSLGRMELAGLGKEGAREPYTIWRSWSDFVELSGRLSAAFPVVTTDKNHSSGLPSAFYQQTPRLPRKLALFVTRSTLVQRQDDLDLFVRRLFDMPHSVTRSAMVCDFFKMKDVDQVRTPITTPTGILADVYMSSTADPEGFSVPDLSVPKRRVGVKHSTPDLRKLMLSDEFESAVLEGSFGRAGGRKFSAPVGNSRPRPPLPTRNPTLDNFQAQSSNISRSSTASSVTITPNSAISAVPAPPLPSPSYPLQAPNSSSPLTSAFPDESPVASTVKRLTRGPLRHFRSLQDLRQAASSFREPPPPMPTSIPMVYARSRPIPRTAPSPLVIPHRQPIGSEELDQSRSRSGSASSTSSFSDGTPLSPIFQAGAGSASFRRGPMGRLDRVSDGSSRPSRPTFPAQRNFSMPNPKPHGSHSPTPSASSIDSFRSSTAESTFEPSRRSSERERGLTSQRSSTEYSDFGSSVLATPPTPFLEAGEAFSTYFLSESGKLTQNNKVPPPPFFPVPPSMASPSIQTTFSQDSLPPSMRYRRRASEASAEGGRSRATSTSSGSVPLPTTSSPSTHSSTSSSAQAQDRPNHIIFKILHADSNFVLRVDRTVTLEHLRALVDKKYAQNCSISLGGEAGDTKWALAYGPARTSADSSVDDLEHIIETETEFQSLLERSAHHKVRLRVVR